MLGNAVSVSHACRVVNLPRRVLKSSPQCRVSRKLLTEHKVNRCGKSAKLNPKDFLRGFTFDACAMRGKIHSQGQATAHRHLKHTAYSEMVVAFHRSGGSTVEADGGST
jgi:hypothetical protein